MKMSVDQALRKARSLSPEEAELLFKEILARFPGNKRIQAELQALAQPKIVSPSQAELNAVVTLYNHRRLTQALDLAADLLTRFGNSEILHNITGAIHAELGHLDKAVEHYDRAIQLAPDFFEAYNNRGTVFLDQARPVDAIVSFGAALQLNPGYAEAHMNLGIALSRVKRFDEALTSYTKAIQLNPRSPQAYNNRGNLLTALKRGKDALADYDKAIALRPDYADALVNRGNALRMVHRPQEAVTSYDAAIALSPTHVEAFTNRGSVLKDLRRFDEALVSHQRALRFKSGSALLQAEVRNLQSHMCLWNEGLGATLAPVGFGPDAIPPFYMLSFEDSPQRQLECAKAWTAREYGAGKAISFPPRAPGAKIRIGYFSADFHGHATMYLMARLFELHDKSRFEIHAFSYGPDVEDEMRQRLRASVDGFHQVGHLDDAAIAKLARAQSIDIAVDLKGHTQDTRSSIFAHRTAPVQVNYLGFPGTMGADFIDYIVADAVTIPAEDERFYSEKVIRLPHCYQPNDNAREISGRMFSRSELGLPEDGFVFCCFNNNYKITPAEFDIWARLLKKVDGSVLWLLMDNEWAADNLRREAQARGISPGRLVFADRMPLADHLARHRQADLFLDTFNVNAHTTASDALWAGLPVVTKIGSSFVARVAASLLHAIDLPELVTDTAAAYEQLALALATDPARLAVVKAKLANNRLTTPLFDTEQYARDIEAAYERMLRVG